MEHHSNQTSWLETIADVEVDTFHEVVIQYRKSRNFIGI
jgi:hypothetical protein